DGGRAGAVRADFDDVAVVVGRREAARVPVVADGEVVGAVSGGHGGAGAEEEGEEEGAHRDGAGEDSSSIRRPTHTQIRRGRRPGGGSRGPRRPTRGP